MVEIVYTERRFFELFPVIVQTSDNVTQTYADMFSILNILDEGNGVPGWFVQQDAQRLPVIRARIAPIVDTDSVVMENQTFIHKPSSAAVFPHTVGVAYYP